MFDGFIVWFGSLGSHRAMIRCSSFAEKAMADEGAGIMDEFILG